MSRARLGMILVLAGGIGGSLWWVCVVPFQPARMLHAIPREAIAVTVHRDLAGRQEVLLANPVTRSLIAPGAETDSEAAAWLADPGVQSNLRRFGSRELVAAFVPRMGPLAMDACIFTSWLGGRSHWLRWVMLLGGSDMRREQLPGGRVYWITHTDAKDFEGRTLQFSLTFEEGLAIGCLSADPHNLRMAIACYDRNLPSVLSVEPRLQAWTLDAPKPDRGWVRAPGVLPFRYQVTELAPDRFAAELYGEGDWSDVSPARPLDLPALFGSLPFATATMSRGLLAAMPEPPAWAGDLLALVNGLGAAGVGASVFGGDYGGRLRGIRTPALVVAVPCTDPPAATALMYRLVHRIGTREGVDLVVAPAPGDDPRIYSLDTVAETFYGRLPANERIAFCVTGGWLLIASNRNTLERLLERREWAVDTPPPGNRSAYAMSASVDLVRGEKPLRNVLAVYALIRALDGGGDPGESSWLALARSWVRDAGTLGRLDVRAHAEDENLKIEVEVAP